MKKAKKIYVVCNGRHKGIYDEWWMCRLQVDGYKKALYHGFTDPEEAIAYCMNEMPDVYYSNGNEEYLISIGKDIWIFRCGGAASPVYLEPVYR